MGTQNIYKTLQLSTVNRCVLIRRHKTHLPRCFQQFDLEIETIEQKKKSIDFLHCLNFIFLHHRREHVFFFFSGPQVNISTSRYTYI